jgi:[amino group carrier protein]-L-2-aminoadipate 6-kinase
MKDITVVKCGGNAAVRPDAICADIAELHREGLPLIVVHGGSADIERLAARLGVPNRQLVAPDGISTRYTDASMLEVVTLALAGAAQPRLTAALGAAGVRAVGLTGLDGAVVKARRKLAHRAVVGGRQVLVRDNHGGRVTGVDVRILHALLAVGVVPVIAPPALAEDGRPVNVDADRVAAAVAAAVAASTMVMLTGAPGVLADPDDEASVLAECAVSAYGPPPVTGGGMGLKLVAASEALRAGVARVLIADGRRPRPVRSALAGAATAIVLDEPVGIAS